MSIESYPLLSVIVPVYGTEKFLRKCLDSLLAETYPNMEIIVVDDASPDESALVIQEYIDRYPNVICVKNPENQGLFQARLRGYEASKGDYICSVDSDDFVGIDYHRQMMLKALETDADIVVGKFVLYEAEHNTYYHRTYGNYAIENVDLLDKDIISDFYKTDGETSHRWLVWNKIYKKALWDRCYHDLMKLDRHHIMLEDLIYGTVFMCRANRYVSCDEDTYFYVKHPASSTGLAGTSEKLFKNLSDQLEAFAYITDFLQRENVFAQVQDGLLRLRQKQARVWSRIVPQYSISIVEQKKAETLLEEIGPEYKAANKVDDPFFYRQHTPWDKRFEELKQLILSPEIRCISFDIFDTLILRPFFKPTDLFSLLNPRLDALLGAAFLYDFAELRIQAERQARLNIGKEYRYEDVTLQEIYDELAQQNHFSPDVVQTLMREEQELEVRFCTARQKLKEIYDLAVFLRKEVICISDMYLDRYTIEQILNKNGYTNINKLFISCEERLTKASGHLYEEVLKRLNIQPEQLLHIGDNWNSDIAAARARKLSAFFVPKASSLFGNHIPDIRKGKRRAGFEAAFWRIPGGNMAKYSYEESYLGIRCMLGLVSNKMFDHPFWSYEPGTDFNRSPYYLGYYALGMHTFGIVQWLLKLCRKRGYRKIHFVARDGYAAMKVYEIVSKYYPDAPEINYFYMSRKSLLPLTVERPEELYGLPKFSPYKGKTGLDLIEMLKPILNWDSAQPDIYWRQGVLLEKPIENEEEYRKFVAALIDISYSQEKNDAYRAEMKSYFSSIIGENEVMFDVGYSGRAQAILSSLLGYAVNAAYIHYLDDQVYTYRDRFGFQVDCYYNYVPTIIGKLREILQSDTIGSCVGYERTPKGIVPVLEESIHTFHARFVIERAHQGACDFARDFMETFSDYLPVLHYRDFELNFAHEYYLHHPTRGDMQMFSVVQFEDDVLNGKGYTQRLTDLWWKDLKWYGLRGGSRPNTNYVDIDSASWWKRAIYNLLFDRKELKQQVKKHFASHPLLCRFFKVGYKGARGAYRGIKNLRYKVKHPRKEQSSDVQVSAILHTKKIDGTGKILYSATSEYGILCCVIHKLTYHRDAAAILMISEWRKGKADTLKRSNIFSEIHVFNDLAMRHVSTSMNSALKDASEGVYNKYAEEFLTAYEENFPFDMCSFEKILVHNATMPLGSYLEYKGIFYEAFEDASGLFSDPELLVQSIKSTFPLVEQKLIEHYHLVNQGAHCNRWYINYDAQSKDFDHTKTIDFNPIDILKALSEEDRNQVLRIFGVTPSMWKTEASAMLVLTYPMSRRLSISSDEQKLIYAVLIDLFVQEGEDIYLKPHPDDNLSYREFANVHMIAPGVLSELLWYETGCHFQTAISAVSTALNNLSDIPDKIYFDEKIVEQRAELLRYFVISHYIEAVYQPDTEVVGVGAFSALLQYLLRNLPVCMQDIADKLTVSPKIYVIGNGVTDEQIKNVENALRGEDILISLKELDHGTVLRIAKVKRDGSYFGDLQDETVYVRNSNTRFAFKQSMATLNIELAVEEISI